MSDQTTHQTSTTGQFADCATVRMLVAPITSLDETYQALADALAGLAECSLQVKESAVELGAAIENVKTAARAVKERICGCGGEAVGA